MYHEFATDPKIQRMTESNQRRFIMLLCMRCCNGDVTLHDEDVAFQMRISDEEWATTKALFVSLNLIDEHNLPCAWDKRQKAADSSAARVRRHRSKQCNGDVTLQKRYCNALEGEGDREEDKEKEGKDIVGQVARRRNVVPVSEIVEYLNTKAGTQYKPTADVTKRHIKARWAEKFTIEDFQVVIDHKVSEWGTDAKMREFLRPQTLFGPKFESYLQAAQRAPAEENQWGIYGKWKDRQH